MKRKSVMFFVILIMILSLPLYAAGDTENEITTKPKLILDALTYEPQQSQRSADDQYFQEVFEKTGVQINMEFVPEMDRWDRIRVLLSTDNMPDIMILYWDMIQEFAPQGLFLPIEDYMEYLPNLQMRLDALLSRADQEKLKIDGKLMYLPALKIPEYAQISGTFPMIRLDYLEKYNLSMPTNFDELYQVLKTIKTNEPDLYPWTNRYGTRNLLYDTSYPFGTTYYKFKYDVEKERFIYGAVTPEFKELLAFHARNYAEGILDPEFMTNTWAKFVERLSTGKSIFYWDNSGFPATRFSPILAEDIPEASFATIPPMEGINGLKRNYTYPMLSSHKFVVSRNVKDPVETMKFANWLYSDEASDLAWFGIEGETFEYVNGEPKLFDSIVEKYGTETGPQASFHDSFGGGMMTLNTVFNQSVGNPWMVEEALRELQKYSEWLADGTLYGPTLDPPLTTEETERVAEISLEMETILLPEFEKIIVGRRPVDDFEEIVKPVLSLAKEWEEIYNGANDRIK